MFDDREKKRREPEAASDDEVERPTVIPPFAPTELVERTRTPVPEGDRETSPDLHTDLRDAYGQTRPPMVTLHDPEETLAALERTDDEPPSRRVTEPPPARRTGAYDSIAPPAGKPVASGLLSLANARIPSIAGPLDAMANERQTAPPPPSMRSPTPDVGGPGRMRSTPVGLGPPPEELVRAAAATSAAATGSVGSQATRAKPGLAEAQEPPQEMQERIAVGDYTGALAMAEDRLEQRPDDNEARETAEICRGVLRNMYLTRIGSLVHVPTVIVSRDQLRWLSIDHRAGFVLSLIDGVSTVETVLDLSGMPELDALRILAELSQQRVIAFH